MSKLLRAVAAAILALICLLPAAPASAIDVQIVKSPKGITAWLVNEGAAGAPVVYMSFAFRPGALRDPAEKEGLANMLATLLDEGAGELDGLAFQRRMEALAMTFEVNAGRDTISASMRTLSRNAPDAFRLLGTALSKPRFEAEPLERVRAQIQTHLRRELRDPNTIAHRNLLRSLFPNHPYGRTVEGTVESVGRVARADLFDFHRAAFAKDTLVVGVVGRVTPEELAPLLDLAFGDLPDKAAPLDIAEVAPSTSGQVTVLRLEVPQSVVIFGHAALKRDDKDYFAAMVMNHILGGGSFSSRLYNEIREKRGLAYSVYSYLNPLEKSSLLMGQVSTENGRVKDSIDIVRAEWKRLAGGDVGEAEVAAARTYITGSYPLRFASASTIARMLVNTQIDGMPTDYFKRRNEFVNAVTLADVKRVAARLLQADKLTFIVVGNPVGM
jgi:zinc protease